MENNETWAPSLLSHNILSLGWNASTRRFNGAYLEHVKLAVKQFKVDFINLQQLCINSPTQRFLSELINDYARPIMSVSGKGNGLMTFYKKGAFILEEEEFLLQGYSMALTFRKVDTREKVILFNCYFNSHHSLDVIEKQFKVIEDYMINKGLNNNREETILWSGDINLDTNDIQKHKRHRQLYDRFLQRTGLSDVLAEMDNFENTWRGMGDNALRVGRLDVILSNKTNLWKDTELIGTSTSDHKMILLLTNPTIKPKNKTEIKWNPTMFSRETFIEPALETISETLYLNISSDGVNNIDYGEVDKKKLIKSFDDNTELYDQLEYGCATILFLIITKIKDIHDRQIKNRKSAKGEELRFQKRIKEVWRKIDEGDEERIFRQELDQLRKDRKGQIEEAKDKGQKYRAVQKVINAGAHSKYIFRQYDKKRRGGGKGIGQIHHNGIKYESDTEIMEIFTKIHADKTSEKIRQEHLENKMEGIIDPLTTLRENIIPENVTIDNEERSGTPPPTRK